MDDYHLNVAKFQSNKVADERTPVIRRKENAPSQRCGEAQVVVGGPLSEGSKRTACHSPGGTEWRSD